MRTCLKHDGHIRDLAMFNVEVDSKLRAVKLRACQLLPGHSKLESTIRYLGVDMNDSFGPAEQKTDL